MKTMIDNLLQKYAAIFEEQKQNGSISWAVRKNTNQEDFVRPTIPFVGKKYVDQPMKILMYASAENMVYYNEPLPDGSFDDEFENDEDAVNRHRDYFDFGKGDFFRDVHINPISNGSMVVCCKYIAEKLGVEMPSDPVEFLECISFGNFGKFSIAKYDGKNKDYAKDHRYLQHSLEYIKADIELLEPDVIIMMKTTYGIEKTFIDPIKGNALIVPIMQINGQTINGHIKKYEPRDIESLSPDIRNWYDNLKQGGITGGTKQNFLSVFSYLDDVLSSVNK